MCNFARPMSVTWCSTISEVLLNYCRPMYTHLFEQCRPTDQKDNVANIQERLLQRRAWSAPRLTSRLLKDDNRSSVCSFGKLPSEQSVVWWHIFGLSRVKLSTSRFAKVSSPTSESIEPLNVRRFGACRSKARSTKNFAILARLSWSQREDKCVLMSFLDRQCSLLQVRHHLRLYCCIRGNGYWSSSIGHWSPYTLHPEEIVVNLNLRWNTHSTLAHIIAIHLLESQCQAIKRCSLNKMVMVFPPILF